MTDKEAGRALQRIHQAMFAVAAGGILVAFLWRGWKYAAGFAIGALASWLNFRWLKQIVDALAAAAKPESQRRPPRRARVAVVAGLRYLLLGGGAYVILNYSEISVVAAVIGLFVAVAA